MIAALVVIAAICGVWLKARLFHSVTVTDICIPLIFFNPRQIGQIFVVANWAHGPLPLLLVVLYCLSWTISSLVWRYGLVLAINFVTIYTGFGLFLGLVTPLAITADYLVNLKQLPRGKAYSAGALLISLVSFGSFFAHYAYAPEVGCRPNLFQAPASYMKFIFLMFANVIGAKGLGRFPALVGAVLLACMLWALVVNCVKLRNSGTYFPRYLIAATLLLYPMLFSGIAAYGRSCLGFPEAQVSRYVMYLELGLLGLYISALAIRAGYLRVSLLLLLTLAFANTLRILPSEQFEMEYYRRLKVDWKSCYVKYADIHLCDQFAGHWIYNEGGDEMLKGRLDYLQRTKQNLYSDVP